MHTCLKQAGAASVAEAARLLRAGEVVGIPTETVYGLAANALSDEAVPKIFAAKGRPQGEQDKEGADQDTQPEFRKHPEDVDSRHGPRQRCRQHGQKRFPEAGAQMHQGHAGIDKEVQDAADQDHW